MDHESYIIGIAGGTCSGKTTVANSIIRAAGAGHISYIEHDDYYRDQSHLSMEERRKTNYDHPKALETELLIDHLHKLNQGQSIEKPTYDFTQHTRSNKTEVIHPSDVIIVEGILIFESKDLRKMLDLKIYVDADSDIRFIRRVTRDMNERGRTFDFVVKQYLETVRPMHLEFVEPTKRYADVVIPEEGNRAVILDLLLARIHQIAKGSSANNPI